MEGQRMRLYERFLDRLATDKALKGQSLRLMIYLTPDLIQDGNSPKKLDFDFIAKDLELSKNVVMKAIALLTERGYIQNDREDLFSISPLYAREHDE